LQAGKIEIDGVPLTVPVGSTGFGIALGGRQP
jgi:hypothetical protein